MLKLLPLLTSSCLAEPAHSADSINALLKESTDTIEDTRHKIDTKGLKLPFYALFWPTPKSGVEVYQHVEGKGHGVLMYADRGSEVMAPASGVVKYVGPMGNNPSVVIVDHRQQVQTIFIGLDKNSVRAGQSVYSGQRFARIPSYGTPVQDYYFELRHKGKAIDPMPFMRRRG